MKLQDILTEGNYLERGVGVNDLKRKMFSSFSHYHEFSEKDKRFQLMYNQAMKMYPQHRWEGTMYRRLNNSRWDRKMNVVPPSVELGSDPREIAHYEDIVAQRQREVMRYIKDHEGDVYSFSQSFDFVNSHRYDVYGSVILQQTAVGLDLPGLLTTLLKEINGKEYVNHYQDQYEILCTLSPNCRIVSMKGFSKGDPNHRADGPD